MKFFKLTLLSFLLTSLCISCDEDETITEPTTPEVPELSSNCKIDKVTRVDGQHVNLLTYHYEGDKIVKITEKNEGASEDHSSTEVSYDNEGNFQKIEEFSDWGEGYKLRRLYLYTYNAEGQISVINEERFDRSEAYSTTTTMTYKEGQITSSISTGSDNMKVSDIVYENGNMKSAKLDFNGDGSTIINIIIKSDDKYNHAKHDIPTENILDLYNQNNMISVECVEDFTMPGDNGSVLVTAGSKIVNRTLSYDTNGEVVKMIDHPTIFDDNGEDRTKIFSYICK